MKINLVRTKAGQHIIDWSSQKKLEVSLIWEKEYSCNESAAMFNFNQDYILSVQIYDEFDFEQFTQIELKNRSKIFRDFNFGNMSTKGSSVSFRISYDILQKVSLIYPGLSRYELSRGVLIHAISCKGFIDNLIELKDIMYGGGVSLSCRISDIDLSGIRDKIIISEYKLIQSAFFHAAYCINFKGGLQ